MDECSKELSPLPWSFEIRMDGDLESCEVIDKKGAYVCWVGEDEYNRGWAKEQAQEIVDCVNSKSLLIECASELRFLLDSFSTLAIEDEDLNRIEDLIKKIEA